MNIVLDKKCMLQVLADEVKLLKEGLKNKKIITHVCIICNMFFYKIISYFINKLKI